jgi:aldose 1-epimerase
LKLDSSYKQNIEALSIKWAAFSGKPGLRLYTLENDFLFVTVTNYGLRIIHLLTPGEHAEPVDIIVGPENPDDFFASDNPYYGAVIGRYANRIDHGRFQLNGEEYQLACNNGAHHLHGGRDGLHNQVWDCIFQSNEKLIFSHTSAHQTEHYPGTLKIEVSIELVQQSLKLTYNAHTDVTTVLNLTHHPFFNLNGSDASTFDSHQLQLNAGSFLPVRNDMIPEGILQHVAATPFDFTFPASITERLGMQHEQLESGNGFDHCFVRNNYQSEEFGLMASVFSGQTNIQMDIYTTEPGVQLYTGNFMEGNNKMKKDGYDVFRSAFCLETQHFPDSPNQPSFPSTVLEPGDSYNSTTIFRFSVKN